MSKPRNAIRIVSFTLLFSVFLSPITIDTFSVNYSFLLLPLFYLLVVGRLTKPPVIFLQFMGLYALIFILASAYQYELFDQGLRRIVSFGLFLSMFSYMFIRIDAEMMAAFKASLVLMSLILSIYSMYLFFVLGGSTLGFEAKDLVGSQRVGFVYLVAIWLLYLHKGSPIFSPLKYAALAVLVTGLLLTFSRSSVVGLLASFGLFAAVGAIVWFRRPSLAGVWRSVLVLASLVLLIVLANALVPLAFSFFEARLLSFLLDTAAVSEDLSDVESTGGTRIFLLSQIIDYVMHNPFTGSGYLGVWAILGDDFVASAHNQYADVLLRTGVIGFAVYIYLLFLSGKYLHSQHRGLFWGFVAVLCYGMFHETFKESQGAFLLAFIFGMMSQSLREASKRTSISPLPRSSSDHPATA